MKFKFLFLLVLLIGCSKNKSEFQTAPLSAKNDVKLETQKVIENLQSKPQWLFPADACPVDVMPAVEHSIGYLGEGCAENPEIYLEKCQSNDGNACYSLALFLQDNQIHKTDYLEALFLRSCKLGIISGCTNNAAGFYDLDSKDSVKVKCAADTFEKTCSRNDPWGCAMYGIVLSSGVGREKNIKEALKYLHKACDESVDEGEACQQARQMEEQIKSEVKGENK